MSARGTNLLSGSVLLLISVFSSSCSDSTAPPPKPTRLALVTAPPATTQVMVPLTIQPVVQTVDANGNAIAATTTITASVIGGNGEIEAGGTATTDASGRAAFAGLTLGGIRGALGRVTLEFSAPGLDAVTTMIDLQCGLLPLSIPETVNRSLSTGDCTDRSGSWYMDFFGLTTSQPVTAVSLTLDGAFPGNLGFLGPNASGPLLGYYVGDGTGSNRLNFKVLLPAGRTILGLSSTHNEQLGAYTLTTAAASEDITCDFMPTGAASPITSAQKLSAGDCVHSSFLQDFLAFGLPTNATINASMSSAAFDPSIKVLDELEGLMTSSTAPGAASVTFTNTGRPRPYYLLFTTSVAGASGPYSFTMNITYPASSAAAMTLSNLTIARPSVAPIRAR